MPLQCVRAKRKAKFDTASLLMQDVPAQVGVVGALSAVSVDRLLHECLLVMSTGRLQQCDRHPVSLNVHDLKSV